MADWLGLGGKICVVSGAGGGIGRAIALELARSGARVAVIDLDASSGQATADAVAASGGTAVSLACDITNAESLGAARELLHDQLGPCDILVNNAALIRAGRLDGLSLADWDAVMRVNLTGFFLSSQMFAQDMAQGGSIIHIGSAAGSVPQPTSGAYSVSKAGVEMLSRNIAMEWGERGIRSNVVSPAMVITPMSEVIYRDPQIRKQREMAVPLRRIGAMQDIADAVCFLASDRAGYISGQEIQVDGGWSTTLLATVPRPGFDTPKSNN